jgi:polar amino acid transport system substrate-binding protein
MKAVRCARLLILIVIVTIGAVVTVACRQDDTESEATVVPATPTNAVALEPTTTPSVADERFVTIATDAPFPPFSSFDELGTVVGFDAKLAENLMMRAGYDYEFVVTNFHGMLESVAGGEFDVAMSALTDPEPLPGVRYSDPYLEVGQVLVVLANEQALVTYNNVPPEASIGIPTDSQAAQQAALEIAGIPEADLQRFDTVGQALQALIDGQVRGVIIDHDDAEHFTRTHYEQLKIAGGQGREAWITHRSYVIGVREDRPELFEAINEAIAQAKSDGTIERITRNWLVSKETIEAGESLIGTPEDIIVIGVLGQLDDADPAATPSNIGWEVKYNTMSGLYRFDASNNLAPALASGAPEISEDGLEYTFTLRPDLTFPDGSPLTAEDVQWSISRAASLGNWHVNAFLKDDDGDFIADAEQLV